MKFPAVFRKPGEQWQYFGHARPVGEDMKEGLTDVLNITWVDKRKTYKENGELTLCVDVQAWYEQCHIHIPEWAVKNLKEWLNEQGKAESTDTSG